MTNKIRLVLDLNNEELISLASALDHERARLSAKVASIEQVKLVLREARKESNASPT